MKTLLLLFLATAGIAHAQIPVTDIANLANNSALHAENLAKWMESIAQLKTQIDQLHQQIDLQTDLRRWAGDPAAAKVRLDGLGTTDLVRDYGRTKAAINSSVNSLASLQNTGGGNYRALPATDVDGHDLQRDALTFRRYATLDATQANADETRTATEAREKELQGQVADTLEQLESAPTQAEAQKLHAKLTALNGQLAQVDSVRRREVDAVALQKIANDARIEEERLAAAELAAKDDYLANRRVTAFLQTLKVRSDESR
jgi:hypothetical protein